MTLQLGHIVHGTQDAGDDELVEGNTLDIEAVVEGLTYVLQQDGSTWHQIRNAAGQPIDMIERTLADVDKFLFALLGIFAVLDGTHAPLLGSDNLHALAVGERYFIVWNAADRMVL